MVIISINSIIRTTCFKDIMQIILIMFFEIHYSYYECYINYVITGWLKSIGSWVVYELDGKPVLYVIPIEHIPGKLQVVPVGDTKTIQYHLSNFFPGAPHRL